MDPTRAPIRSIHPTKAQRRPKLKPGPKHHLLNILTYFEAYPSCPTAQDSWSTSFPWSISLNKA